MEIQEPKIITKSPGKTLLSGGYLILDKSKKGLVINIDTYITCESFITYKEKEKSQNKNSLLFNIKSEYLNETFNYISYIEQTNNENKIKELKIIEKNNKKNKWIQNCIISSLFFYLSQNENSTLFDIYEGINMQQIEINIIIKSDYRFYSFSQEFKEFKNKNIKTGLGSSSALISSLTTNMILIYDYICKNSIEKENKVIRDFHDKNLQAIILGSCLLSNNLSQNKIGSCFDIISSLFGSQIFSQTKENVFINSPYYLNDENIKMINNIIVYLKDEYIPNIIFLKKDNIFLNNNISFISIEIGTDTRIFVKKVLDYANSKKTKQLYDDELFTNLNMINEQIINIFTQNLNNINNNNLLIDLCKKYRQTLRLISEESKVDIEPKILTPLLDKLIDSKNIIYSICPGAGGYDSIISMGNFNVEKKVLINEIQQIINEFNINNKNKGINIKANILDVNIAKDFGTIVIIN